MVRVCCVVAARSSNGSQSVPSGSSGPQLLTPQDEKLGFEAAVAALGLTLSVACAKCILLFSSLGFTLFQGIGLTDVCIC